MTELERPRSHRDERDEMIDRDSNAAALDAIITGAEVLAVIFFALAGKLWAMGDASEERMYHKAGWIAGGIGGCLMWRFAKRKR